MHWKLLLMTASLAAVPAVASAGNDLESIDVAVRNSATGDRVYLRGFDAGLTEHKFYSPEDGYTEWVEVPDPRSTALPDSDIASVEAFAFADGSILYVRGFEGGEVQQNVYTPWDGWTGWVELAHPEENHKECNDSTAVAGGTDLETIDVELMGNDIYAPRIFVRGLDNGLFEQCVYTPTDGFTEWSEIPGMPDLLGVADNIDDELESIQVAPTGGLNDPRLFVAGFRDTARLYHNLYTPGEGFSGWRRVRNQTQQALGTNSDLESVDVKHLGDFAFVYLRGRDDGRVQQNFFTPEDGFLGWRRVTRTDNQPNDNLDACSVELFDPGLNGRRIYVRCFNQDERSEQCFYDPKTGTTRWEEIP